MGSFLKNIKYEIMIGKLIGFIIFSEGEHTSKVIDHVYSVSLLLLFYYCVYCAYPFKPDSLYYHPEFVVVHRIYYLLSTITFGLKWIYLFKAKQKIRKLLLDIDQFTNELETRSIILRKPIKKISIFICITFYLLVDFLSNITGSVNLSMFLVAWLPFEVTVLEQVILHGITEELLLHIKYINNYFNTIEVFSLQDLQERYDEYKNLLELSRNAADVFGLPILITLSDSFVLLPICIYSLLLSNPPDVAYVTCAVWLIIINLRLFFAIYNWSRLTNEVKKMFFSLTRFTYLLGKQDFNYYPRHLE